MKKGPFILLAYFLLLGASSCLNNNNDDDDCADAIPSDPSDQFDIMSINNQLINVYLDTSNSKVSYQYLDQKYDSVLYTNYGITVEPEVKFVTIINLEHRILTSIFPSAYACIPIPPPVSNPYTLTEISNIEIITHQDFDSTHLAGSNVADLFQVIEGFYGSSDFYTIEEYIDQEDTYFKKGEPFLLHLISSPTKEGKYRFTVKITLEDAAIDFVEYKTTGVFIKKE